MLKVSPTMGKDALLRIGGRLNNFSVDIRDTNPVIQHCNIKLIMRHMHELVHHQDCHLAKGAIRFAGYFIIGGKRLISSILHLCVKCRRLRKIRVSKDARSPADRLTQYIIYICRGRCVWILAGRLVSRRTRGGQAIGNYVLFF